jgi:hypothetical protein
MDQIWVTTLLATNGMICLLPTQALEWRWDVQYLTHPVRVSIMVCLLTNNLEDNAANQSEKFPPSTA